MGLPQEVGGVEQVKVRSKERANGAYRLAVALIFVFGSSPVAGDPQHADGPISYTVRAPDTVQRGKRFEVSVRFDIQEPWYIYAPTGKNAAQGMIESKVRFRLPEGITEAEALQLPRSRSKGSYEVYEGMGVTMSQALLASEGAQPGPHEIKVGIRYQVCKSEICLPPVIAEVGAAIHIE